MGISDCIVMLFQVSTLPGPSNGQDDHGKLFVRMSDRAAVPERILFTWHCQSGLRDGSSQWILHPERFWPLWITKPASLMGTRFACYMGFLQMCNLLQTS